MGKKGLVSENHFLIPILQFYVLFFSLILCSYLFSVLGGIVVLEFNYSTPLFLTITKTSKVAKLNRDESVQLDPHPVKKERP